MNDYIIPLNKVNGVTSAKALGNIKYNVNKKVGHTGTLDKFASGLLIALTGRYTKLTEEYMNLKKTYLATIEFGKETDTLDPEGSVVAISSKIPDIMEIEWQFKNKFIGLIEQEPPKYSALRINGKRASDIMRDGGDADIKKRNVTIYSNEIISYNYGTLVCRFTVSRGTYIRSIARDLAIALKSRAYLKDLKREQVGPFTLNDAVDSSDEETIKELYSHQKKDNYVVSIGVFDGIHLGHKRIIEKNIEIAKRHNLKSLILTFDKSPKGVEEFLSLDDKLSVIKSFGVDEIKVLEWNDTLKNKSGASFMLELLREYNIKKIVTGMDFSVGNMNNPVKLEDLKFFFRPYNVIIENYVSTEDGAKISSTYIHSLYNSGSVSEAEKLLSR